MKLERLVAEKERAIGRLVDDAGRKSPADLAPLREVTGAINRMRGGVDVQRLR